MHQRRSSSQNFTGSDRTLKLLAVNQWRAANWSRWPADEFLPLVPADKSLRAALAVISTHPKVGFGLVQKVGLMAS